MAKNDELELEEDLELEGQENEGEVIDPDDTKKGKKEEEEEDDLEIVEDPIYAKPNWEEDPAKTVDDPADKDYGKRVQKRIDKLKASASELARQRQQKEQELAEAVRYTQAQQKRILELESAVATGNVSVLERKVEAEERAAKLAESEYLHSLQTGEPDKIVAAQSKLTNASVEAANARRSLESLKTSAAAKPAPKVQEAQQAAAAAPRVSTKVVSWMQKNAWFSPAGGDELSDYAIRVHNKLVELGKADESDAYFSTIDKSLRNKFPERFGVKQAVSPVTPGTRTQTQRANGSGAGKLKLTSAQVAYAKSIGLDTKEKLVRYAQEVAALEKEGNK